MRCPRTGDSARALDDTFTEVSGERRALGARREWRDRLLDVEQAKPGAALRADDVDERRASPQAERAAALHPECRVGHAKVGVVVAVIGQRDEPVDPLAVEEGLDVMALVLGERPEALPQPELHGARGAESLAMEMAEAALVRLSHHEADRGALLARRGGRPPSQRFEVAGHELLDEERRHDAR
jgi:hypothetical protein